MEKLHGNTTISLSFIIRKSPNWAYNILCLDEISKFPVFSLTGISFAIFPVFPVRCLGPGNLTATELLDTSR